MQLDKLDLPLGVIIVGIIILFITISQTGTFGVDIDMRPGLWTGIAFLAVGLTGIAVGTCQRLQKMNQVGMPQMGAVMTQPLVP